MAAPDRPRPLRVRLQHVRVHAHRITDEHRRRFRRERVAGRVPDLGVRLGGRPAVAADDAPPQKDAVPSHAPAVRGDVRVLPGSVGDRHGLLDAPGLPSRGGGGPCRVLVHSGTAGGEGGGITVSQGGPERDSGGDIHSHDRRSAHGKGDRVGRRMEDDLRFDRCGHIDDPRAAPARFP